MIIAPSILSANINNLEEDIQKIEKSEAQYLHIDIMDGHFVPNLSFGPNIVQSLRKISTKVFDVHLMVENPDEWIEKFATAGADVIGVHYESSPHIYRTLTEIKKLGKQAEIVINPATPIGVIEEVLPIVDQVLVMTVNPGFGGQEFIENMLDKIAKLDDMKKKYGYQFKIEVDGGINEKTIQKCKKSGANIAVAGSYIFAGDIEDRVKKLNDVTED